MRIFSKILTVRIKNKNFTRQRFFFAPIPVPGAKCLHKSTALVAHQGVGFIFQMFERATLFSLYIRELENNNKNKKPNNNKIIWKATFEKYVTVICDSQNKEKNSSYKKCDRGRSGGLEMPKSAWRNFWTLPKQNMDGNFVFEQRYTCAMKKKQNKKEEENFYFAAAASYKNHPTWNKCWSSSERDIRPAADGNVFHNFNAHFSLFIDRWRFLYCNARILIFVVWQLKMHLVFFVVFRAVVPRRWCQTERGKWNTLQKIRYKSSLTWDWIKIAMNINFNFTSSTSRKARAAHTNCCRSDSLQQRRNEFGKWIKRSAFMDRTRATSWF